MQEKIVSSRSPKQIKEARRRAAVVAMRAVTDDLLGQAQREAPVEEGTLRGSGSANVDVHPGGVTGEVTFDTPYAARQHEDTSLAHPMGGKAKFLEDPLKAMANRYLVALAKAMERA